jgi:hypothetical protein
LIRKGCRVLSRLRDRSRRSGVIGTIRVRSRCAPGGIYFLNKTSLAGAISGAVRD